MTDPQYFFIVIHFTPLRVPVRQLALYGRVQIWQNQANGLGLRVIPTLLVIAYIDNIYTVGKVISSSSPVLFTLYKISQNTKFEKVFYIFDSKYINAY